EPVAIRKVAIHCHGSDAHGAGDPAHGDGFSAAAIEQPPSRVRAALRRATGMHVYSVYHGGIRCTHAIRKPQPMTMSCSTWRVARKLGSDSLTIGPDTLSCGD